jgi:hypothetical protein
MNPVAKTVYVPLPVEAPLVLPNGETARVAGSTGVAASFSHDTIRKANNATTPADQTEYFIVTSSNGE